jgi:trehalose synthase
MAEFAAAAAAAVSLLRDRGVINVNSTGAGGGVAEMLQTMLAYGRGLGIDTRWMVIAGDERFFTITKRIHNHLYGSCGDGGPLGVAERTHYEAVLRTNAEQLRAVVRTGDVVVLHDPQTIGLASAIRACGARVVWRCHVGHDTGNEHTEAGWDFLRPYVEEADALVFTKATFAPAYADPRRMHIIAPSIDPFSTKNVELERRAVESVLAFIGFHGLPAPDAVRYTRRDGSPGRIDHAIPVFLDDPPPADAPLVLQVSRWDPMKDMRGVMLAFARHGPSDAHLLLVGPDVEGVADDREAASVLEECRVTWRRLPPAVRARVHLAGVPMYDVDANSIITNALQRCASVVTQKSLAEGFGLTVAEAMWKARPIVASRVGGIPDQIEHEVDGLLLDDPTDLPTFGALVTRLLEDRSLADRVGAQARRRATAELLGDRHLERWGAVFESILT